MEKEKENKSCDNENSEGTIVSDGAQKHPDQDASKEKNYSDKDKKKEDKDGRCCG